MSHKHKDLVGKTSLTEIKKIKSDWILNNDTSNRKSFPIELKIKVFFAYWCHDSEREIPRFISEMSKYTYDDLQIEWVLISRDKKKPEKDVKIGRVYFTPTFIFYNNKEEITRFVERPNTNWENDIRKIINKVQGV